MNYDFQLTYQANEDLDEIVRYISVELANKKAAIDFLTTVEEVIQEACLFPESGLLVENDFLPDTGIRKKPIGHYHLYYLPKHDDKTIVVLRIIYGKRDLNALLLRVMQENE